MWVQIIITTLLIFSVWLYNLLWLAPQKKQKFYIKQLQKMNYRVKLVPYKFLYHRDAQILQQSQKNGDPLHFYKNQYQNYDVIISNIFNSVYIQFCNINFIADYFSVDKHNNYKKHNLTAQIIKRITGNTSGFLEGHQWRVIRNIQTRLFTFQFLKQQTHNIANICDRNLNEMQKKCEKVENQNGKYINCNMLHQLLQNIFSSVIIQLFLGFQENPLIQGVQSNKYIVQIFDNFFEYQLRSNFSILGSWFFDLGLRKIDRDINCRQQKLYEWGRKLVNEKIKKIESEMAHSNQKIKVDNLIKSFLVYKKQHKLTDDDRSVSHQNIFKQFLGLYFAGTDTTTHYVDVALHYIAKYPQIQQKIRQQVSAYMKEDDFNFENFKKLEYIDAVLKQTTRCYGPANNILTRQATNDNYLNGLAIKKGTLISIPFMKNFQSQQYFFKPLQFRPERWLNGQCDNLPQFINVGFSGGARTCLGKHLAMLQSKIVIAKFFKRYKKIQLKNNDFTMILNLMFCPKNQNIKLTLA